MTWTDLNFGKHSGKSLSQVLFMDPDWFFWAIENDVFSNRPALDAEAELLSRHARHIVPPRGRFDDHEVEYLVHHPTNKFSHFDIVPRDLPLHKGSSPAFRSSAIDMSVPRRIAKYDKTGCKSLVSSLKFYFFGSKSARITKARAEAFFSDSTNFK